MKTNSDIFLTNHNIFPTSRYIFSTKTNNFVLISIKRRIFLISITDCVVKLVSNSPDSDSLVRTTKFYIAKKNSMKICVIKARGKHLSIQAPHAFQASDMVFFDAQFVHPMACFNRFQTRCIKSLACIVIPNP